MPQIRPSRPPGAALGLTPHASMMPVAHARAEPAFSTTWEDLGRLRAPDSCLTECMLPGAACMLQSIRAYRLEFAQIFRDSRPGAYTGFTGAYGDPRQSIHGNPRSIRRISPEHTPGRTHFALSETVPAPSSTPHGTGRTRDRQQEEADAGRCQSRSGGPPRSSFWNARASATSSSSSSSRPSSSMSLRILVTMI